MNEPGSSDASSVTAPSTLLLVRDEENIIASSRQLLRRDGCHILTASGGEACLQILDRGHVDVIVSDQRMPGTTGTAFLSRAREKWPQTSSHRPVGLHRTCQRHLGDQ